MSQFSKDELSFVEELPEHIDIECPVCLNILSKPHLVSCCGHNFCEDCIERVKASNGACPMCKERRYQSFIDKKCLRIINLLQVYCTNKEKGCQWKGELKNLSTHLNKGEREGECQYEEVKCRYEKCEEKGQRQYLKHHEDNDCLQRPFECQYCNTTGTYHSITEEHYKKCSKYPVLCPNQCTLTQMPRGSVTDHVNNECPLQPVDCVFSWAGCKEKPLRKDIELHTTDTKHMMILAVACGELKKENEKIKDQIVSIHHVIANDMYPVLPITIIPGSELVHCYTDICGHHISFKPVIGIGAPHEKVLETKMQITAYIAFHEGIFDRFKPKLPRICAKHRDVVIPLIDNTYTNNKQVHFDALRNTDFLPFGVIKRDIAEISAQSLLSFDNSIHIFAE